MGIEEFLDISEEEMKDAVETIAKYTRQDGRICLCGHTIKSHSDGTFTQGILKCQALKDTCVCRNPRPVVESSNGRYFLKKTHGSGSFHALSQGMHAALEAGYKISWINGEQCDRCEKPAKIMPVVLRRDGKLAPDDLDTGLYALLCATCRSEL